MKDPFLGKAIVNGEVRYTSVTALKLGEACLRRFIYRYVHNLKDPETKPLTDGIKYHGEVEHYLKTGDRSQLSSRVLHGLNNLPTPGPDLFVELPLLGTTPDNKVDFGSAKLFAAGIPVYGKIDLVHERPENHGVVDITDAKDEPGVLKIEDHKFTKSMDYALNKQGLIDDLQTAGYGLWAFLQAPGLERVRLSHNYFPLKGSGYKSTALTDRENLERTWKRADAIGVSLIDAAHEPDIDKIDFNLRACRMYGHDCPAKSVCRAANHNSLASLIGPTAAENALVQIRPKPTASTTEPAEPENNDMSSILDRLRAQTAGQAAPAPVAPPILAVAPPTPPPLVAQAPAAPAPAPAPAPAAPTPSQADIQAEMARLKAAEAAAAAPPAPATAPAPSLVPTPVLTAEDHALLKAMAQIRKVGIGFPRLSGTAAGHVGRITGRTPTLLGADHFLDGEGELAKYTFPDSAFLLSPECLPSVVAMAKDMGVTVPDDVFAEDAPAPAPTVSAAPAPAATIEAAAATAEAPKPKRGRPKKEKTEDAPAPVAAPVPDPPAPVVNAPTTPVTQTAPVESAPPQAAPIASASSSSDHVHRTTPASSAINVYVDCAVDGLTLTPLWPKAHEICAIMTEKAGGDFRLVDAKPWNYGGWRAILKAFVTEAGIGPGNYSFDGQSGDIGVIVVEALRELAHKSGGVFVRGAR